ncbi:LLM class flavin-dependent oxidoreductase [Bordetella genomosp. 10]|uniref:LLM class flavin-dependent oxidoreductase n=1 Tax=Bordetella genomosp. 10 TaxID=1416804 RepID=A0A261SJM8_9BORD|nr:LLM class flavin-dependent oxidoreductase [Bordetella genomosp. 10]OZI37142.1 LLM class flavin-dependent oxidoreductase [Bordetella genomosp. 10]
MATPPRKLHFNVHVSFGSNHEAAWRLPDAASADLTHFEAHRQVAVTAERGKLDAVFYGDQPMLYSSIGYRPSEQLDPIALQGALSVATSHIGLAVTASTSFNEPFNLARKLLSLDHLSKGRIGWNIVTTNSDNAARNFGLDDRLAHAERYRRAEEFVQVVTRLWDSWLPGAVVNDKTNGVYADLTKIRQINHQGKYFKVLGPLNLPPSPQGRPVLIQAGSSETGIAFAARHADAVFTAQDTLAGAQSYYRRIREQAARSGRNPDNLRVMVGLSPILAGTEAEAQRLAKDLEELIVPEAGLRQIRHFTGVDLSGYPLDKPVPLEAFPALDNIEGHRSRATIILESSKRENLTVRQLIGRLAGARGHQTLVGSVEQVADRIAEWFENGAADGFNYMPAVLPQGLDAFVDGVIPILRQRGLFRYEYEGSTLREHYGLPAHIQK